MLAVVAGANARRSCAVTDHRRAEGGAQATPALLEACRRGEHEAFRLLFDAYKDRTYSIALHLLGGDTAAAEDVTQEVFVRLFRTIGQFRGEAEFGTWLYRLVANACVDEQRRLRRFVPLDAVGERFETGGPPGAYDDLHLRLEVIPAVQAALAGLPTPVRMAILLKYFDDLSYEEMARQLDCSPGTVASRLHRGLKLLARRLAHLRGGGGEEECSPGT